MKNFLVAAVAALGGLAVSEVEAEAGGPRFSIQYSQYSPGYATGYGYGQYAPVRSYYGYHDGYYAQPRVSYYGGGGGHHGGYHGGAHSWHDTSHYDYHPGGFVPHYDHYDYVPGHYDYHEEGHWDHNHH